MAARNKDRVFHQDYIVRQRYSNALPPPPGAPKLLDIPNPGLDYYTSPAFASRMGRQEPLNIEADAFLGMTINLVGMPGIFDGDESCLYPPTFISYAKSTNIASQPYKPHSSLLQFTPEIATSYALSNP